MIFVRIVKVTILLVVLTSMIGCASVTMPPPSASVETLKILRTAKLSPSSVGDFSLAPDVNPNIDNSVGGLRGIRLRSESGSFSTRLKNVVIAELKAAGLYDERSQLQIEAQLLESKVDAAISTGTARLSANFTVDKAGDKVFEKVLSVDSQWESSFVGDIAVPEAINEYSLLYKLLVKKLFDDKGFQAVLAR